MCNWSSLCWLSNADVVLNDGHNGIRLRKLTAIHRQNATHRHRSVSAAFSSTT